MEKIYCGSARIIKTQYGDLTKVSFNKDDINKIVKWMKENSSDWANLVVKEKREKAEGKPTHYLEIDEWKPDTSFTKQEVATPNYEERKTEAYNVPPPEKDLDLPF